MSLQTDQLTLAEQVYLLQCDPSKHRLNDRGVVAPRLIRAGALADLSLQNAIKDRDGRVAVVSDGNPAGELSAFVLARIYSSKPRKWKDWIQRDQRETVDRVEAQLQSAGVITVTHKRILWVFPAREVVVHDIQRIAILREIVRTVAFGVEPVEDLNERQAVLAAIVGSAGVRSVISRQEAKQAKSRIEAILGKTGPIGPAPRKAIKETQASLAATASIGAIVGSTSSS